MTNHLVIAIDGPAASGKGTIGRLLAERYQLPHLDTGLTYRAVANALIEGQLPLDDVSLAESAANSLDLSFMDRTILSSHEIGSAASKVAVMSGVRAILVEQQRNFASTPPGAVLDGRDIGTVVCPSANVKFFITATAEERAKRRWKEIASKGSETSYDRILIDIKQRDERDMSRNDSPLKPAEDAYLIDTSEMSIETAFQTCVDIVERYLRNET